MQVIEAAGDGAAWCMGREGRSRIDMSLLGPQPPGTWLLTFMGAAREVMTPEAAGRTDAALDALAAVLAGDTSTLDDAFADLVSREPQLPEHLRERGPKKGPGSIDPTN
jgi:hydrogenase expression/formation protein HypC